MLSMFSILLAIVLADRPGSILGAADFAAISSARPPRIVQLGARLRF